MDDDAPEITVVTPSYRQADYLEENVRSVPSRAGTGVEHVVVDGGSEDGTVALLERMAEDRPGLRWVSEPDEGQPDAVNKGVRMARGEWIAVQNSDDYFLPGAFEAFRRARRRRPGHVGYYANVLRVDAAGEPVQRIYCSRPSGFVHRYRGLTIRHQTLFLHRDAWAEVGGWDVRFYLALDYDWIGRLLRADLPLRHVAETWAAFRGQAEAKSERATGRQWREEIEDALGGPRYPGGVWTRPFLRGAAAAVQWMHIVADNGPGALADRLAGKLGAGVRDAPADPRPAPEQAR